MVFGLKKLALSAVKNGVSFSTLKQKYIGTTQWLSSLGMSTPFSKAPMSHSHNVPLCFDCDGTVPPNSHKTTC